MVDYVSDMSELLKHLRAFAFSGEAPEDIEELLQTLPGVPADVICGGAELLYAHYDLLPSEGKKVCGELFNYASQQGWNTFNQNGRSADIVALVGRDLGERKTSPEPPAPDAMRRGGVDWRQIEEES